MCKRLLFLVATLAVAQCAVAQAVRTAVDDFETTEVNRLAPRVDVTPYSDEDDIERGSYAHSAFYLPLGGVWRYDLRDDYADRSAEVEGRAFSTDGWDEVELPCFSWSRGGDKLMLPAAGPSGRVAHEGNLSALLYRSFEVAERWKGYTAVLRLQGRSAYHVWVNRQYAGYAEDSRAVNEFDITRLLRYGKRNDVVIQLAGLSSGSLLESAYDPMFNGVGEAAVTFFPATHIDDYKVEAVYDAASGGGMLSVDASVVSTRGKGRYYLEVELWNPQGREAAKLGKWLYLDSRKAAEVHVEQRLNRVEPWSAERPACYTAVVRLLDEKMRPLMSTGSRTGFRTVALENGRLTVNGRPLVLRGVAYVDNGQSVDDMRADLLRMKHHNVNAVRTVHYSPARGVLYDLCDELGLFVMCDANLQPFSSGRKAVAADADYADLFVSRVRTMQASLKNHPSIILWSLGGSADNGVCMTQAYRELKRLDRSRPVVFAGGAAGDNSDLAVLLNPTLQEVRQYLSRGTARPLLVAAYGTAEGNPYGGLQELWQLLSTATAGGFAASWNSYVTGDAVTGQRVKHSGIGLRDVTGELREAYRPFDFSLQSLAPDAAEFSVVNRNHSLALSDYRVGYVLYSNLKPRIVEGDINTALAPGEVHTLKLRLPKLTLYAGEELMIRFEVRPRDVAPIDRAAVLSTATFLLPSMQTAKQPLPAYDRQRLTVRYDDSSRVLTVAGRRFEARFDCGQGTLCQLVSGGENLLQEPLTMDFWRATASGDAALNSRATLWMPYRQVRREVVDVDYREVDSCTVAVNVMSRYSAASGGPLFDVRQRYTVLHSGDVLVDNEVRSVLPMAEPPRVGVCWGMAPGFDSVGWTGRDRVSFSDRKAGSRLGGYSGEALRMHGPYADTRRLTLRNGRTGLYVDMLDTLFGFELQPQDRGYAVHADYRMAPAGGIVTAMPATTTVDCRFVLHLRPYDARVEDADDFCRTAYPVETSAMLPMPVITAGADHFNAPMQVTLSLPPEAQGGAGRGAEIRYTLDGSVPGAASPRYTAPFSIEGSTTVSARTLKAGMPPSFVSSRTFYFDYVSSVTLQNKPNTPYNRHFERALTDGVTGTVDDLSHGWIGFSGSDFVAVVELGRAIDLNEVRLRFAHQPSAWVFGPVSLSVAVSGDGVHYDEPVGADCSFDPTDEANASAHLLEPVVRVSRQGVRFLRIEARNVGRIPDWHPAKGLRAWLMTDEITLTEMLP
ncbi:MAG: beta-galactosidase [bacterium P3]|nr:MAG: beta-galactosidase [bacterium P3]KWW41907.1 MAG: beta-galactosidase [bacterium F083]